MWWVLLLVSTPAFEPCGAQEPSCARDIARVISQGDVEGQSPRIETRSPAPQGLPEGELTAEDLWQAIEGLLAENGSMRDLYALLADGKERWISGEVIRELFAQIDGAVDFLPLEDLVSLYSDGQSLVFRFDFGGDSSKDIKMPATRQLVLTEPGPLGGYEVGPRSKAEQVETKGKTFRVSNEVQMYLSEEGILGIRQGDIKVKAFFWFTVDFHTEHREGGVALSDGKPVLRESDTGGPLVIDGFYQPQRYDDWAVIEAGGRVVPNGLPPLSSN